MTAKLAQPARRVVVRFWRTLRDSVERFDDSDASRLSASMSYYALFSVLPLLLVLGALAEYALGDSAVLRGRLLGWATGTGSHEMRSMFEQALDDVARRAPSPVGGIGFGLLGALLGAGGFFVELDGALTRIFGMSEKKLSFLESVRSLLRERVFAFVIVLGTSLTLLVTTIARGALELPSSVPGAAFLGSALSLALGGGALTAGIALCYRLLPAQRVRWSSAWTGAVVASLLLHAIREPFAYLLVRFTTYAAYGVIGAILGVLAWFQVAACLLLFGACVAWANTKFRSDQPVSSSSQ